MIRKLQTRLILVVMTSVMIVLFLIIGGINMVNYSRLSGNAEYVLTKLAKNGGTFDGLDIDDEIINVHKPFPDGGFTIETRYKTRYFTVKFLNSGDINTNTKNIASVDDVTAVDYATDVLDRNKESGFLGSYRYLKYKCNDGLMVLFMDCSSELYVFEIFLQASALFILLSLLAILMVLMLLSKRILSPLIESYDKQKRFITDASHELKTPLTIISANNELMEMEYGENETTHAITKQIQRLTKMTNNLTMLSKVDEIGNNKKVIFNLSETAKDVVAPYESLAESKKIKLDYTIDDDIKLKGDEKLMRQMLSLMLDNCLKYGKSEISLSLKKVKNSAVLEIKNDGQNIEEGNLDKYFQRFFRSDESRASGIEGSGIGLSIVKGIADWHKGKISARGENNYFILTVVF